jgi:hypothetical protein
MIMDVVEPEALWPEGDDPFVAFTEWGGQAGDEAYADL